MSGREAAHALRSALGAMRTWARVLEGRLAGSEDPVVARALEGLRQAISQQVGVIENQLEAGVVEPPLRRAAMRKRNDASPDIPAGDASEGKDADEASVMKPQSPGPRETKPEDRDAVTRKGER